MQVPMADMAAQHRPLKAELMETLERVIDKGAFVLGMNVASLEQEIATFCGAEHGVGVNSGTDALLMSLLALGIEPGDEVITTPFTFVATVETICLAGATPVLADIDPGTFNMSPALTAAQITPRTRALMPVHLFGQLADMSAFSRLAQEHGLPTIGDAAQAIGAMQHGKPIGSWSDCTTLSFYPTKNLGGLGDGGMVLTNRADLAERARLFRFHGSGGGYFYKEIGYCSRLDEMQAALVRVKARHLPRWNDARRRNASLYYELLHGLEAHLTVPPTLPGNHHIYHQFTVRIHNGRRDALKTHLAGRGIQSGIFYPLALHLTEAYAKYGFRAGQFPESERATQEVLSIPIHPDLTEAQIEHVARSIRAFFA